jgi:hypothetical protein
VFDNGDVPGRLLLGVEMADGRRATTVFGRDTSDGVVFHGGGGGGGQLSVDQSWWLSPLPPEGRLRFVVRCAAVGIEETITELDATVIRQAADRVEELWPWSPPDPGGHSPPPPPDLPPGSWFAA